MLFTVSVLERRPLGRKEKGEEGGVVIENCCQPQQAAKLISNLAPNRACLPATGMLRASRRLAAVRSTRGAPVVYGSLSKPEPNADFAHVVVGCCNTYPARRRYQVAPLNSTTGTPRT